MFQFVGIIFNFSILTIIKFWFFLLLEKKDFAKDILEIARCWGEWYRSFLDAMVFVLG